MYVLSSSARSNSLALSTASDLSWLLKALSMKGSRAPGVLGERVDNHTGTGNIQEKSGALCGVRDYDKILISLKFS